MRNYGTPVKKAKENAITKKKYYIDMFPAMSKEEIKLVIKALKDKIKDKEK